MQNRVRTDHGRTLPCSAGGILRRGAILCGGAAYGSDCTLRHINLTLSLRQQIFFFERFSANTHQALRSGDMPSAVDTSVFGYVKVEVRSRSPKLWGWNIHRTASDNVIQQSETLFGYAEDAWKEGQRLLSTLNFEQARPKAAP
jgi:hypothetical protein